MDQLETSIAAATIVYSGFQWLRNVHWLIEDVIERRWQKARKRELARRDREVVLQQTMYAANIALERAIAAYEKEGKERADMWVPVPLSCTTCLHDPYSHDVDHCVRCQRYCHCYDTRRKVILEDLPD